VTLEQVRYRGWRDAGADGNLGKKLTRQDGHLVEKEKRGGERKYILLHVEQTYRKYQFFSVRTEDEIKSYILRSAPGD
jgi:hypothetical protein